MLPEPIKRAHAEASARGRSSRGDANAGRWGGTEASVSAGEKRLQDLMCRALDGDDGAYQHFLLGASKLLRAFFHRKLVERDRAHVEDLVQETLLAIHLHRRSYDRMRPIGAWLYAIARYKLVDHFRKHPSARSFIPIDAVADLFAVEAADAGDPSRDIAALLSALPEKQSQSIRLVKLEDLTAKQAAARMGVSEADVKISIHRGLKKLMALIAKDKT